MTAGAPGGENRNHNPGNDSGTGARDPTSPAHSGPEPAPLAAGPPAAPTGAGGAARDAGLSQHRPPAGEGWRRWWRGGLLGAIGFLLSPLSWWNDLFINVPLALGVAWGVALIWPAAFEAAFIVGYWLTNVLGLVLLTRGARELLAGRPAPYSRRELFKDLLVAAAYTVLIVVLIKLRLLQPLQEYGR